MTTRLLTAKIAPREIQYSYWVQFLKWLANKCEAHAEAILDKHR